MNWLPAKSKSEARRLIRQGAVKVNGKKVVDENTIIDLTRDCLYIIQRGKKYWIKVSK